MFRGGAVEEAKETFPDPFLLAWVMLVLLPQWAFGGPGAGEDPDAARAPPFAFPK